METKICRICGKLSENYVHIFKREGLKNKIETCLPIIVSPHCLLPDTICCECSENVDNFYSFIKNCLQNIIILEAQYDIHESCLKTKRKHEKSCMTDLSITKFDKNIQTDEDFSDIIFLKEKSFSFNQKLAEVERILTNNDIDFEKFSPLSSVKKEIQLVDYEVESDNSEEDVPNEGKVEVPVSKKNRNFVYNPEYYLENQFNNWNSSYFDDTENNLINEITNRKDLKRKSEDVIYSHRTKIFKMDTSSRRKNRQPKKLETNLLSSTNNSRSSSSSLSFHNRNTNHNLSFNNKERVHQRQNEDVNKLNDSFKSDRNINYLPQACLLCDAQLDSPSLLAKHVYETHGIDMAQVLSSEPVMEKKKKLPNLVKITDLKCRADRDNQVDSTSYVESTQLEEQPPTLQPSIVCPICPSVFTNRPDLFNHLRTKHVKESTFLCGLCLTMTSSYANLNSHVEKCRKNYTINGKYICKICAYNDDNSKLVENHVTIHDFILTFCKQQSKIFDPIDYIDLNPNSEGVNQKTYQCNECGSNDFQTFKDFSEHRRNKHQIFHCDLCNKFYGRNSHLWKHVNRLHKGHPSITCQLCYKTSASKYHLAQHFNKLHNTKSIKNNKNDDFLSQKFEGFDFQSVRQSFMKQELLEQSKNDIVSDDDNNSDYDDIEKNSNNNVNVQDNAVLKNVNLPKEIDASSDLYTNIITNYTPPQEGEFKCPKCFKGFEMKVLLKKHKKNCRPRLQKDLLTRCKTCSRIFKDRQSLAKHLINYHSEYACEICEQKVQSKCEIVSHIRFSHPNCHLFCHCGNILRNTGDLIEHQIDHGNSFVCQFCGDALQTKIKLKMHILSLHRKILSLSCGICLKLFETQHILRDHVQLVHKDHLKPFISCTVCGKNYGSKWKTYDHLNKSHGRIFKACKLCLEIFDTDDELQKHYDCKHLGTPSKNIDSNYNTSTIIKKETYESDYEDEKNFLSDLSNDYDNDTNEICDFNSDGNKMSLLEKRLLVNNKHELINNKSNDFDKNNKVNKSNNKNRKIDNNRIDNSYIEYKGFTNQRENHQTIQSSSKRTVYVNSNDPSLCEICKKTWPAKKHLWQHYIRCHKTVAATVCGICLKANENYETLQKHLTETHPTLLHGQGFGSNFICRICGRYHNASSKLKLHMAIHENFDWSILEKASTDKVQPNHNNKVVTQEPSTNGYYTSNMTTKVEDDEEEEEEEDIINYESLIEQVECTSESEINDSDSEIKIEHQDNHSINTSTDNDSENESNLSDLENEMLKNMIKEKKDGIYDNNMGDNVNNDINNKEEDEEEDDGIKQELVEIKIEQDDEQYSTSDTEEEEEDEDEEEEEEEEQEESSNSGYSELSSQLINEKNTTSDDENSINNSNTNDSLTNNILYDDNNRMHKSQELDSAIRSISYAEIENIDDEPIEQDYADIQSQSLNQHELQSAVDSIL